MRVNYSLDTPAISRNGWELLDTDKPAVWMMHSETLEKHQQNAGKQKEEKEKKKRKKNEFYRSAEK